ncbi:MAG: alpha/beta fold hydrolase [Gammaproteobacteria bacterium]|nr:alpha/beta fold hydrolase [Gammaproteobacteria bacterium]
MKSKDSFTKKTNKWLCFPKPNPEARLRLFCFPYAGGGAHIFFPWQSKLSPWIEVCAIQLPGRGTRYADKPYTHHKQIVTEVLDSMSDYMDKPYAVFGHSMGALLAYELVQEIQNRGLQQASHLFVSGRRAMHIASDAKPIYDLSEEKLISKLRQLNGTPAEVLDNKDLMSLILPVIRADFQLCDTYSHDDDYNKLAINITAFEGDNDHKAQGSHVSAWQELTNGHFESKKLAGDHFFIHSNEHLLLKFLDEKLFNHIGFNN